MEHIRIPVQYDTEMVEVCDLLHLAEIKFHKAMFFHPDIELGESLAEVNRLKQRRAELEKKGYGIPPHEALPSVREIRRREQKNTRPGAFSATPAKLRNGEWGARVEHHNGHKVAEGDKLEVSARSGKTWTTKVLYVSWSNDKVSFVATAPKNG